MSWFLAFLLFAFQSGLALRTVFPVLFVSIGPLLRVSFLCGPLFHFFVSWRYCLLPYRRLSMIWTGWRGSLNERVLLFLLLLNRVYRYNSSSSEREPGAVCNSVFSYSSFLKGSSNVSQV